MSDVFCALASAEAEEMLVGSAAADTDTWVLFEHEGAWAGKPLESETLAPAVRARLAEWLEAVPRARLQLLRRPEREAGGPTALFIGRSGARPWLVQLELPRPEVLCDLDLEALLREEGHPDARPIEGPLHLVCTHGKRDRCCAKWGMPVYQALDEAEPGRVWQTSHTGGHRFAANVVSFPHGVSYGRIEPAEAGALARAHREGRLHSLDRLRGRTCYDGPTQAAELFLRRALGRLELDAVRHRGTEARGPDRWLARFELDAACYEVEIAREDTGARRPKSCGDELAPVDRFTLLRPVARGSAA